MVNLILVSTSEMIRLSAGDWGRIVLIGGLSLIYLSGFVLMGLLVSSTAHTARTSLAVLLLIWVFFVVIVPAGGGALIHSDAFSTPSPEEIERRAKQASRSVWESHQGENLFVGEGTDASTRRNAEVSKEASFAEKRVVDTYRRRKLNAVKAVRRFVEVSPPGAFAYAAEEIVGTGIGHVERFLEQLEEYRKVFEAFFIAEDRKDKNSYHLYYHPDYLSRKPVDVGTIPRFQEREPDFRHGLARALGSLAVLLIYNVLFFLGAYLSFLRYDVR